MLHTSEISYPLLGVDGSLPTLNDEKKLRYIRNCAIQALWYELITYPKPGLVSLVDSGSHLDMDAGTFHKSILSLRHYFYRMAILGFNASRFELLRQEGIAAEVRMMARTGGVNTHRGAIFNLGILVAAAACKLARADEKNSIGHLSQQMWGDDLLNHCRRSGSHGSHAATLYNVSGAVGEAYSGFSSVYTIGLPVYRSVLKETSSYSLARVQTFYTLMANVADTNLLHRGGLIGLHRAQNIARDFLSSGGIYSDAWQVRAIHDHHEFVGMNLSPGGSADLLGACIFTHSIEGA